MEKGPGEAVKRHSGEHRNKSKPEKIRTAGSYKVPKQRRITGGGRSRRVDIVLEAGRVKLGCGFRGLPRTENIKLLSALGESSIVA